jgi:hypothetical protein
MEAVPERLRPTFRRAEALAWAEHLARHQGQPLEALRLIAGEVARAPLEGESWRALLRNGLPAPLVRALSRLRHRWRSTRKRTLGGSF